jgi:hypothetical protein
MRRPCADREEKRVTLGSEMIRTGTRQEQLDLSHPNQRRRLDLYSHVTRGMQVDAAALVDAALKEAIKMRADGDG